VKTNTENIEAELVEANDDFVFRGKQENLKGKGKETVEKTLQTPLEIDIKAIVTVTF
jgi:ribosome maturation factor RimP